MARAKKVSPHAALVEAAKDPVQELLAALDARGLRLVIDQNRNTKLVGDRSQATEPLLQALKIYKEELIDAVGVNEQTPEPPATEPAPVASPEIKVEEPAIPEGDGAVWWMFGTEDEPKLVSDYRFRRMCAELRRHNDSIHAEQ